MPLDGAPWLAARSPWAAYGAHESLPLTATDQPADYPGPADFHDNTAHRAQTEADTPDRSHCPPRPVDSRRES